MSIQDSSPEVHPCPACGKTAHVYTYTSDNTGDVSHAVSCVECPMMMEHVGWELPQLVEHWNTLAAHTDRIDQLEKELAEARKDALSARSNLAWVANNIERKIYDDWGNRAGVAEDAKATLRRQRTPSADELALLAQYYAEMETP